MRRIIKIDETRCDGCGFCAEACHEGAIMVENGKARLINDSYCDGLGDCLGECPRGAISFETREAALYDEVAVKARLAGRGGDDQGKETLPCGCPGSMARQLNACQPDDGVEQESSCGCKQRSQLGNWPVQLRLVPVRAPYLEGAKLLIAADCTAFAHPNFHSELLPGMICLVGCPKLDETESYVEKIAQIIRLNATKQIDVAYMEVPCCGGLVSVVESAIARSGAAVELNLKKLSLDGKTLEIKRIPPSCNCDAEA